MAIENKVTSVKSSQFVTDEEIQTHIDEMNADGFVLLSVHYLMGWYRFFWSKTT